MQMVTFRLADSLPREAYERIMAHDGPQKRRRLEEMMDSGRGACVLRNPAIARVVVSSLNHFDGRRYRLIRWVVMPNHAHVPIEQIEGYPLGGLVQGWKSFTAKEINNVRRTSGSVWAADYFDRFIRSRQHFGDAMSYIDYNPVAAGLVNTHDEWPFSSAARNAGGTLAAPGNEASVLSGLI
ncbi:MAG TPA: hypothetical protein VF835_06535 [Rhizomicrobium sp.]